MPIRSERLAYPKNIQAPVLGSLLTKAAKMNGVGISFHTPYIFAGHSDILTRIPAGWLTDGWLNIDRMKATSVSKPKTSKHSQSKLIFALFIYHTDNY